MRLLRAVGCLAVGCALALLPACNKGGGSGKIKVAFITNNPHEFWSIARRGTEKAATDFDVDVDFKMPAEGGSQDQRRFIEDLLNRGIKGIAISPNDSANQVAFFKEVNAQVPLIAVDSDIPDQNARRCYLGTNNIEAGKAAGELVKKALPAGGTLMIFVGKLDVQNAIERRRGLVVELAGGEDQCRDQLEQLQKNSYPIKFGKYTLLGTMTDDTKQDVCRAKVEDTLNKYPDISCLVGLWAYNPPAMLVGVRATPGKVGKVVLVGFDENEETLEGIKDRSIYGTIVQDPYQFGYQAIKLLAGIARKDPDVFKGEKIDDQKRIFISHRIVTKDGGPAPLYENVEDFHKALLKLKGK